ALPSGTPGSGAGIRCAGQPAFAGDPGSGESGMGCADRAKTHTGTVVTALRGWCINSKMDKNTMTSSRLFIIKIGGNVIDDPDQLAGFLEKFAELPERKILVHGGGKI